jgi:hypothetical protein
LSFESSLSTLFCISLGPAHPLYQPISVIAPFSPAL